VVFGRLAAEAMAANTLAAPEPDRGAVDRAVRETEGNIRGILDRAGRESPFPLIRELQETMFRHFGIFREGESMREGLRKIRGLRGRAGRASPGNRGKAVNQALVRYLELGGMLRIAEVVALGAIAREESRGSHTRRDFPSRDDTRFLAHTLARGEGEEISLAYRPVTLGMFPVEERGY
jgi:succinate dehydrogenase / fumarate reductase flavoprotein subunit